MFKLIPLLGAAAALSLVSEVSAFTINPCLRTLTVTNGKPSQEAIRRINPCGAVPQLKDSVHEHMTLATVQAYAGRDSVGTKTEQTPGGLKSSTNLLYAPTWRVGNGPKHQTIIIVQGTWWNDDPSMYLWGSSDDFRHGIKNVQKVFAKKKYATYEGSTDECPVPIKEHLPQHSHFGNLQHLHFMSTKKRTEPAAVKLDDVTANALVWLEFAYDVATGKTKPNDAINADQEVRLHLPSIAKNVCADPRNIVVRSLFTKPDGKEPEKLAVRDSITPDVALGSMLHILQDSFSPSHTCRVAVSSGGTAPLAALYDVRNYVEQDHKLHAKQDVTPAWFKKLLRTGNHTYSNDPVTVGTWLIQAVDEKKPWQDVRDHLMKTIFAKAPQYATPPACI
ncbi:hypothetical protein [Variovorax sp. efr-133-TYG-130]|uniref:hypothetical protein n=1 Tax=Variovorax sp. efr-133-TYG-130 TaxID=3040327 RepID=UPI0025553917|nr:hypothetical protein [Variovorax sp. efr-133-TYG-130]